MLRRTPIMVGNIGAALSRQPSTVALGLCICGQHWQVGDGMAWAHGTAQSPQTAR